MSVIHNMEKSPLAAGVILMGLLALEQSAPMLPDRGAGKLLRDGIAEARGRNPLWWSDLRQANNGYYEQLMHGEEDPATPLTPISRLIEGARGQHGPRVSPYQFDSFLIYKPKPNLYSVETNEGPVVSNRYGFFDRDYSLKKPVGVRRIALMGASIARGWGVPIHQRFETLIENRLNVERPAGPHTRFEVLNFSVTGYRITQMFDVAVQKSALFRPDVYMISITQLTVAPDWGVHLTELVDRELDLRYDFFRRIVSEAGIRKGDSPAVDQWRLAPYRVPALRAVLLRLKEFAERNSAHLIILLVPAAEDKEVLAHRFRDAPELVGTVGVPVVNVLRAFDGVEDIETARNYWYDAHPNAEGHRLLAEEIYRQLRREPAWSELIGSETSQLTAESTHTRSHGHGN